MDVDRLDRFRSGTGPPLVLLHGMFQSWHAWSVLFEWLTPERDVLALTHLGHAGSPPFEAGQAPTIAAWTQAVQAELDVAGLDRPDIVGHSLGGWVALELAKRGRARSVVAISPAGRYTDEEVRTIAGLFHRRHAAARRLLPIARRVARTAIGRKLLFAETCAHPERIPPPEGERLVTNFATCPDPDAFVGALMDRDGGAIELEEAERVRCPVLILLPERDRFFTRWHAERFEAALPDATIDLLPDCGHAAMFDDPERMSSKILSFVVMRVPPH